MQSEGTEDTNVAILLAEFTSLPFADATTANIVYVLSYACPRSGALIPFYVGESTRGLGRMHDYRVASFGAQTDFKVGRAIRAFNDRGVAIVVSYRPSQSHKAERLADEAQVLALIRKAGFPMLNDESGYDYRRADHDIELARVLQFVEDCLARSRD